MAVLLTGASGFIGLNALEALVAAGAEVVAFSARPLPAGAAGLGGAVAEVVGDVRDERAVRRAFAAWPVDRVLHAAALTVMAEPRLAPVTAVVDVNVAATAALLEAARDAGVARFVYVSSSAVYGDAVFAGRPVSEDVEPRPTNLYGHTKLAAERLARRCRTAHGLDTVRARVAAAFGPWERDTGVRETLSPLLQIVRLARAGRPVVLAPGGRRDWTGGRDVGSALAALTLADDVEADVYNVGLGETWHPELLCRALVRHGVALDWQVGDRAEATIEYHDDLDRQRSPIDAGRLVRGLGVSFAAPSAAVEEYVAWLDEGGSALLGVRG